MSLKPRVSNLGFMQDVFGPADIAGLVGHYREHGYGVLRGAVDGALLHELETQCADAQRSLMAGELEHRHGTTELGDTKPQGDATEFANFVLHVTEISPAARDVTHSEPILKAVRAILGERCWAGDEDRFGFVFQDARPSEASSYKRIGWHSDWQSGPHLAMWPSTAVTVNIDETGPPNGFLRVVPGSHLWATPAPYENVNGAVVPEGSAPTGGHTDRPPPFPMPLRFEKIPGEIAVYAEKGDVFFHDCYLWHAAAMATEAGARRRHLRGSWYGGRRPERQREGDFVKNAAR